jgi:ferredoxin
MNNIKNISKIKIEASLCNKCGNCTFTCPWQILQFKDNNTFPQIVNHDLCVSCGHCIAICPTDSIIHPDFKIAAKKVLIMNIYNLIIKFLRYLELGDRFENFQINQ